MDQIGSVASFLQKIGVIDVLLPFVLVFTLTWGALERTQVLGEDKRRENAITAGVIALLTVFAINILNIINMLIMYISAILLAGICLAMVYGLSGGEKKPHLLIGIVAFLFFVSVMYIFVEAGLVNRTRFLTYVILPLIVVAALVATIVYVVQQTHSS